MVHTHAQAQNIECSCSCGHSHSNAGQTVWKTLLPIFTGFTIFAAGLILDFLFKPLFFTGDIRRIWYIAAYVPVAIPVFKNAYTAICKKDFFNEFTLMIVATTGAFLIGEYPEGVAVMIFYMAGEYFQESAVNKARNNIKALLDIRPETATVLREGKAVKVSPENVSTGEIIQIKAGEKIPLDGTLLSPKSSFNTSALTGESVPRTLRRGEILLAGMVNLDTVIDVRVEKEYADSSLARILEMVQNATSRKAKTELLIRKFAHIYTPVVFFLSLAITLLPALLVSNYIFADWLYRALVFLVISCPCALVVSIPLSYFAGIGAASHNGILFKGANYLEMITRVNTVVMDKTGTLTEGVFEVQHVEEVVSGNSHMLPYTVALESKSNHPIAKAILARFPDISPSEYTVTHAEEIPGYGIKGFVDGHEVTLGNARLMKLYDFEYNKKIDNLQETVIAITIDNIYAGYIIIADKIKPDARAAIRQMQKQGIRKTIMLSGDKASIVKEIAKKLKIDEAYGDLLPGDKVNYIESLKADPSNIVAFVGDGINDAPALALSDAGIAMGGMGSDVAIEIADIVIQTDQPTKIATAIQIGKTTRAIVIQNITLALGIKLLVLLLGALGYATMWEAVFADVGVALLAILNAVRILKKKF